MYSPAPEDTKASAFDEVEVYRVTGVKRVVAQNAGTFHLALLDKQRVQYLFLLTIYNLFYTRYYRAFVFFWMYIAICPIITLPTHPLGVQPHHRPSA